MRLQVVDYSTSGDLADAIRRYYTLLQMTFAINIYKIFETPTSQIMRMEVIQAQNIFGSSAPLPNMPGKVAGSIEAQISCTKCGTSFVIQARLDPRIPPKPGVVQFPADGKDKCPGPNCSEVHNLTPLRDQIQAKTGLPDL